MVIGSRLEVSFRHEPPTRHASDVSGLMKVEVFF